MTECSSKNGRRERSDDELRFGESTKGVWVIELEYGELTKGEFGDELQLSLYDSCHESRFISRPNMHYV